MGFLALAILVGVFMWWGGIPLLPAAEGAVLFAPLHYLTHRNGSIFPIAYFGQLTMMMAFAGYQLHMKGAAENWSLYVLLLLLSASLGLLGRWLIRRVEKQPLSTSG
jgi:hypothetical protein